MERPQNLQFGELWISGRPGGSDVDPDEITRRLGVTPARTTRRGEPGRHTGRLNEISTWLWSTPERDERDSEALVLEVLEKFEPVASTLADMRSEQEVDLTVGLVIHMFEEPAIGGRRVPTPALSFDARTVSRLATLGCQLDFDLYVDTSDDEEDYLHRVEQLAHDVAARALDEGWLMYRPEDHEQTPLQRSINSLARKLRSTHSDGDGCLDH